MWHIVWRMTCFISFRIEAQPCPYTFMSVPSACCLRSRSSALYTRSLLGLLACQSRAGSLSRVRSLGNGIEYGRSLCSSHIISSGPVRTAFYLLLLSLLSSHVLLGIYILHLLCSPWCIPYAPDNTLSEHTLCCLIHSIGMQIFCQPVVSCCSLCLVHHVPSYSRYTYSVFHGLIYLYWHVVWCVCLGAASFRLLTLHVPLNFSFILHLSSIVHAVWHSDVLLHPAGRVSNHPV